MDPVSAFGLAAGVVQVVDFTARLISNSKEIYHSTSGTPDTCTQLEEAAENLNELCQGLSTAGRRNLGPEHTLSAADKQLLELGKQCGVATSALVKTLQRLKDQGSNNKWRSIRQAIRFAWSEKNIVAHERKLDAIRAQIDTALLSSLRERMDSMSHDSRYFDDLLQSFTRYNKDWQTELLKAIKTERWDSQNDDDVQKFANQLSESARIESKEQFCSMISARLFFASKPNRLESIANAHQKTFQWMFEGRGSDSGNPEWDSFTDWLEDVDAGSIYWVTGKPGSGKSTLMKYLFHDPRLDSCLAKWSNDTLVVKLGFFFWNSGTPMQMSRTGLLQSILYDALRTDPERAMKIFDHRWEQYLAFGGGRSAIDWPELRRAFQALLSDTTRKFFLVLDGLDEFDGNPKELIDLILSVSQQPNIKICTSSRPWVIFEDKLGNRPSLYLERLTYDDIHYYVTSKFGDNEHYQRLNRIEPLSGSRLVNEVVQKANGVFLWVYLVVDSLLEGLSHSDRMKHLQSRLDALPNELEDLFDKILNRLELEYYTHACQIFRLIHHHPNPSLLELYFADDEDAKSGIKTKTKSLNRSEREDRQEEIERRLKSRCKGFLEIIQTGPSKRTFIKEFRVTPRVQYFHRTAKDFVESEKVWKKVIDTTSTDDFDPDERWANAALWLLKSVSKPIESSSWYGMSGSQHVEWPFECALRLEKTRGLVLVTYLDEVSRTMNHLLNKVDGRFHLVFIKLAVWFQMRAYLQIKLETFTNGQRKFILNQQSFHEGYDIPSEMFMLKSLQEQGRKETKDLLQYYCGPRQMRIFRSKPKMNLRIV